MRRRTVLTIALLSLASCISIRPAARPSPNIYVMRHLHTPAGAADPDLTAVGQAKAQALAQWLSRDPPTAIFVSDTKRARQTAEPAARRFGVTPTLYDPRKTPQLIASVLAHQGTVLVVGHSNTVPEIVAGLGGERPPALGHDDFGDVWHIIGTDRRTTRTQPLQS